MMKAMRALTRYAAAGIEETGLGLSDFGVLEALLHKGPLPVNTIGPIVDLTPGSISIAVDRLFAKGLVSRVESAEDRRVRIVALTPRGKDLIVSAFRKHSGQMKRVFSELSPEELRALEEALKKAGVPVFAYGNFITLLINFLIVALAIFLVVRALNKLKRPQPNVAPVSKDCPACTMSIPIKATRCPHCTSELAATSRA
jgi:MarR family 2-MHQ and catechol resistance regulon transcriptional repressor